MKIYSAVDRRQREEMKKKTSERKDASTGRARLPGASHSLTSRDIESASSLPLGVGSLVLAKKRSAVCSIDDVGMVYVVRLTSRNPLRMEYGIIFESGLYDVFTEEDIYEYIAVLEVFEPSLVTYRYVGREQLERDFYRRAFSPAFASARRAALPVC